MVSWPSVVLTLISGCPVDGWHSATADATFTPSVSSSPHHGKFSSNSLCSTTLDVHRSPVCSTGISAYNITPRNHGITTRSLASLVYGLIVHDAEQTAADSPKSLEACEKESRPTSIRSMLRLDDTFWRLSNQLVIAYLTDENTPNCYYSTRFRHPSPLSFLTSPLPFRQAHFFTKNYSIY